MAKLILVANWKNHPASLFEAESLLKDMAKKRELYKKTNLFIAPPTPYFDAVVRRAGGFAQLASQDISLLPKGTYTGEVTPEILKSFGVRLAIVGHSERRALGETSSDVAEKAKAALKAGIMPLVCFGEREKDSDGEHFELLRQELKASLLGLTKKDMTKVALAYEPVWAIGKHAQEAIRVEDLSQTVLFVRRVLADLFGRKEAEKVAILYGGSVEPANAEILVKGSGVRGLLVGHSSLRAEEFEEITRSITGK